MNNGKYINSPEITEEICKNIILGLTVRDACLLSDISEETYYRWLKEHTAFRESIEKAKAAFKQRNIAVIAKASLKSWQASAWLLERKMPEEFGLRTKQEISGYLERGEDEADKKARKERVTKRLNEILEEKLNGKPFEKKPEPAAPASDIVLEP